MELKVNKKFEKVYNAYKLKEELASTKKAAKRQRKDEDESDSDTTDEECVQTNVKKLILECDDVLNALKAKGSEIINEKKTWFSDPVKSEAKPKDKEVFIKDLNRKLLIENEGKEDESDLNDMENSSMSSDDEQDDVARCPYLPIDLLSKINEGLSDDDDFIKSTGITLKINSDNDGSPILEDEDFENVQSANESDVSDSEAVVSARYDRKMQSLKVEQKKSRSEKRKEKKERKNQQKDDLNQRLKDLQQQELSLKYEKILVSNPALKDYLKPEDLDDDFDPDKHNEWLDKVMADEETGQIDDEKPVFSDSDADGDEFLEDFFDESEDILKTSKKSKKGKKKKETMKQVNEIECKNKRTVMKGNFSNVTLDDGETSNKMRKKVGIIRKADVIYDPARDGSLKDYFKKYYEVLCDDVIKGGEDGRDVVCKFKYRQTEPMDFGLSLTEMMFSDRKELNKWASLKKVVRIRSKDEEEHDKRKYASAAKLQKKKDCLLSYYNDEEVEENKDEEQLDDSQLKSEPEAENDGDLKKLSKASKKRLRKKLKEQLIEGDLGTDQEKMEQSVDDTKKKDKKQKKHEEDKSDASNVSFCKEVQEEGENEKQFDSDKEENSESPSKSENCDAKNKLSKAAKKRLRKKLNKQSLTETLGSESKKGKAEQVLGDGSKKDKKQNKYKKKKDTSNVPNISSSRLESLGIKEGYYKHLKLKGRNVADE